MLDKAREVLAKFHNGYVGRDLSTIDAFMEELFVNSTDTVILGTSNGELCLGFEAAKKLIHADWKGWGDVRFDVDNTVFQTSTDMTWFATRGTLELSFTHAEKDFENLLGLVKEELVTAEMSPAEGLALINWALAMFSFVRDNGERKYLWPITLTGALVPEGNVLKFKYMQFSVPCSTYPDTRVGTKALDRLYAGKPFDLTGLAQPANRADALQAMSDLQSGRVKLNTEGTPLVIGPQNNWYQCVEHASQGLASLAETWGQMELDLENALVQTEGDLTYVVAAGHMVKHMTTDSSLRQRIQDIRELAESHMSAQEKLFIIQRDIAATLKEAASGEEHRWPCRVEVMFSHASDEWLVNYMQLSFPYYWIFEGKIPAERI